MTTTSEPIRTCVGCRAVRPVGDLVRLRLDVDGSSVNGIVIDSTGGGRGAWLCVADDDGNRHLRRSCLHRAASSGAFDRAFRRRVDPVVIDDLVSRMSPPDDGGRPGNRR